MQAPRDEAQHLAEVMAHAGVRYRLGTFAGAPVATFDAASPTREQGCTFFVDAPPGWLRVTTSLALAAPPSLALLRRLTRVQVDTGFGVAALDRGAVRLTISLSGLHTMGSPLIGAIHQLHALRDVVLANVALPRFLAAAPASDSPSLEAAVRAFGSRLPLTWSVDGSYVAHIESRQLQYELRLWSPWPDVFAIEAGCVPARPFAADETMLTALTRTNNHIIAGELLPVAGALRYRWSCPYVWLDTEHVAAVLLPTILESWALVHPEAGPG